LNFCPNSITLRQTHDPGSDKLDISPNDSIAMIKSVIVHIDEPVSIMLLAFHTKDKSYCKKYKINSAEKRFCDNVVDYIHFYLSFEGYSLDESKYLIALLPRSKKYSELEKLANEFCKIVEWLEIKEKMNCLVFRYGPPVHGTDNIRHWQKQFAKNIKDAKELYIIHQMEGKVKHIPTSSANKNMTISKNYLFVAKGPYPGPLGRNQGYGP
jgi:hypothetical protein